MPTQLDTPRGQSGRIDRRTNTLLPESQAATGTSALTSSALAPQPSFTLTPTKPATQAAGFEAYLGSLATSMQGRRRELESQRGDLLDSVMRSDTETGLRDQLYSEQVDPAKAELDDIDQQIMAEQHATRREIEAIQKNPQGLFGGALQDKVDEIQNRSIAKQADLAIIQLSRQGKYDSAKQIADRYVQATLEKQKLRNEALQFNYQENKELFNADEQRVFESLQAERERTLQNEEYRLRAEFDQKIKQSDPLYQASLAKTYADIAKTKSETAAAGGKMNQKVQGRVEKAKIISGKIDEALGKIKWNTTGTLGGYSAMVKGTDAYNLARTIDTIQANIGFDELQAMRDASPTGGALGSITEREISLLQSTLASLDVAQDAETLRSNLGQVEEHYINWVAAAAPDRLPDLGYQITPEGDVVKITR
jgi:hypothetical protein